MLIRLNFQLIPRVPRTDATVTIDSVGAAYLFEYRSEIPHWDEIDLYPTVTRLNNDTGDTGTTFSNDTTLGKGDNFGASVHIAPAPVGDTGADARTFYVFVGAPNQGVYRNPHITHTDPNYAEEQRTGRVHIFKAIKASSNTDRNRKVEAGQLGVTARTLPIPAGAGAITPVPATNNAAANTTPMLAPSNGGKRDNFGTSLSSSRNGGVLIIGSPNEDSSETGNSDNKRIDAGAAYVFVKGTGDSWTQAKYLKTDTGNAYDRFGSAVAMNEDGSRIAIAAIDEDSSAVGIGGNEYKNNLPESGAVYIYDKVGETSDWTKAMYLKSGDPGSGDKFGNSIAFSNQTIVIGAPNEDGSNNKPIHLGSPNLVKDNNTDDSGAIYLY